ncbi:MAG TPA: putative peptidyl-prolyl cis-trans isomerase [Leptospiraceae bacterium]|nr:putative peptidyl-prolyl cis-trans isomerase [Leptospiraceae bacterium]HMX34471.1 putative peptidyl-prolyl cis-trans isomerase [Leptospiraceae bacterium]HMY34249.1 putative peptidyl-prolyl cis-trans isomerase [Leptospiraceae bacterium]HMZ64711.1 putative peptidyl-prolyl cis-trans isomerase [Leptospiraceae bacterium]HNA08962.1 putative peptidyl-prolyl cis-trans isomerase [Leptospiraceae bacterium]
MKISRFGYKFFLCFLLVNFLSLLVPAPESINRILAIVGKTSISQLDFERGEEIFKALQKQKKPGSKPPKGSLRTQVLDFLIARAIIDITADEESIQANEKNVEAEIDRMMKGSGVNDRAQFEKLISERTGLPFDIWLNDLPYQIKRGQLLQVRVTIKPPSDQEVQAWYNANKPKVGFEIKFREICLTPKNGSVEEEQRISSEINSIKKEARKDRDAFTLIASGPRNQAAGKGINDWVPTFEIFNKSPYLVNVLGRLDDGKISDAYIDDRRRYCIVRLEGKRPTPLETIRRNIQEIIQRERIDSSFDDWILTRRKEVLITVYDKEYIAENKLEAPDESFNFNKIDAGSP